MNTLTSLYAKECFISHCSADDRIMERFSKIFHKWYSNPTTSVFNTYDENHTTRAGENRADAIKRHLKKSSAMIAMITDSYLRSTICISEISSFWYTSKLVIPIVFNHTVGRQFLLDLFGKDIIFIDTALDPKVCAKKLFQSMNNAGFKQNTLEKQSPLDDFSAFFKECKQSKSDRRFIGMGDEFSNILEYCAQYGIHKFQNSTLPTPEIIKKLSDKDEIIILSTTGSNLINSLSSEFLPKAISNGCNITVLLPNEYSQFVNDVAEIEMPDCPERNVERLSNEFHNVMINLSDIARRVTGIQNGRKGRIYVGCSFSLLRQTVVIGKKGDYIWGWSSITIPPKKTVDGTPSLEFSGSVKEPSMAQIIYEHLQSIIRLSKKRRSTWFEIQPNSDAPALSRFHLEKISAKKEWQVLYDQAKNNMEFHAAHFKDVLIEVAAQHPLLPDGTPGIEFQKRLDYAVELWGKLSSDGTNVKIYVPGSLHLYQGQADPVALSCAGVTYLKSKGISDESLLGDEKNIEYKGENGVYNSADECFVASAIFLKEKYKQIYCICSPNQMTRKQLFYISFGVIPMMMTAPCNELAHNPIYELFESIPEVILYDHTWQDDDSVQGMRTRKERKPNM